MISSEKRERGIDGCRSRTKEIVRLLKIDDENFAGRGNFKDDWRRRIKSLQLLLQQGGIRCTGINGVPGENTCTP